MGCAKSFVMICFDFLRCIGSALYFLDFELTPQLSETMVAKYYKHRNVITKSKQKNRAYFWTIPFLVKYTGSKEK